MRTNHVELTFMIKRMTFGKKGSFEETTFHIRQSNTFDTKLDRGKERASLKQPLERRGFPVFLCAPLIVKAR